MKNYLVITILCFNLFYSQVGINTNSPKATLDVAVSNTNNPTNKDGVIIPRVTSLNNSGVKEIGLLVFLDYENPSTVAIERGFYYWNGTSWIPFYAANQITTDRTIVVAQCNNSFDEGAYTISSSESDIRNLGFMSGTIKPASATSNFSINAGGGLVVTKKGYYAITGVISMNVTATDAFRRDSFEYYVTVNGVNSNITVAYGFPNASSNYSLTNSTSLSGAVLLNVGDIVKFRINRYSRGNLVGSGTVFTNPVGSISNITLRYLGNF